jgi:hypothetical protein
MSDVDEVDTVVVPKPAGSLTADAGAGGGSDGGSGAGAGGGSGGGSGAGAGGGPDGRSGAGGAGGGGKPADSCDIKDKDMKTIERIIERERVLTVKPSMSCPIKLAQDGHNFMRWKNIIPTYLRDDLDIWNVVTGVTKRPALPTDGSVPSPVVMAKLEKFERLNNRALQLLWAAIHPDLIYTEFFGKTETIDAHEVYSKIKAKFAGTVGPLKQATVERFNSFRFSKSKTIDQNLNDFENLIHLMAETGTEVSNDWKVAVLLSALGPEWSEFKNALLLFPESDKKIESLVLVLRTKYNDGMAGQSVKQATALLAKLNVTGAERPKKTFAKRFGRKQGGRPRVPSRSTANNATGTSANRQNRGTRSQIKCYNCGIAGHYQRDCRKPKKVRQQGNSRRSTPRANIAEALMALGITEELTLNQFILDSGATHHLVNSKKWFTEFSKSSITREVLVGSNHRLLVFGQGTIALTIGLNGQNITIELKGVLYVPKIKKNLISVGQLTEAGYKVSIFADHLILSRNDRKIKVPKLRGLYRPKTEDAYSDHHDGYCALIRAEKIPASNASQGTDRPTNKVSLRSTHELLAHINKKYVKQFLDLQKIEYQDDLDQCESCMFGKQTRASYHSRPEEAKAKETGHVSADLCSPSTPSLGQAKHFLMITDEFSKFRKVYFLKTKDEAAHCI